MPYKNYDDAKRNYEKNKDAANARRRARRDHEVLRKERELVRKRRLANAKFIIMQRAMTRNKDKWFLGTAEEAIKLLHWPTHCPVLGIKLNYAGMRGDPANVSLDRHNNDLPYMPGNVFVISDRANKLKSNATADELFLVFNYAKGAAKP